LALYPAGKYNQGMLTLELLYFDGCPSWQNALENMRRAIEAENLPHEVCLIEITTDEQAQEERFLGSPSFRINGADLWPEARSRYNLSCRVYPTAQGLSGSPTVDMLRARIRELLAE
jgi:hypothetical protein